MRLAVARIAVPVAVLGLLVGLRSSAVRAEGEVVLFVTGPTPSAGDLLIRDRLEQRYDYTVVIEAASVADGSHATGKALVLISSTAPVADVGTKFLGVQTPVATWNPGVFPNLKMTGTVANADFGTAAHYSEVVIANEGHAMAAGHVGIVPRAS